MAFLSFSSQHGFAGLSEVPPSHVLFDFPRSHERKTHVQERSIYQGIWKVSNEDSNPVIFLPFSHSDYRCPLSVHFYMIALPFYFLVFVDFA